MEICESLMIGKYRILQDTEGYRFTSDSILLSRFVRARRGERVADFCAGSGIVGLHFFAENRGIEHVTLFELQEPLARMSERTIALNGIGDKFTVECGDVRMPKSTYAEAFTLILCNPPYERGGLENADPEKAICRKELRLPFRELCAAARRCLRCGGRFVLIHRADRICEVICALHDEGLEPKKLQFVAGKEGANPYAVLISAVKGGKAGVEVLPTFVNARGSATSGIGEERS